MITLFIDTSTSMLTLALFRDNNLIDNLSLLSNEHSKNAIYEIDKLYKKNKILPNNTSNIMITNGPGSFTGIRIGVTIAKVFAWCCKINVIPISSLHAFTLGYDGYDNYVSILDAKRGYVYAGIYDKYFNKIDELYISKEGLKIKVSEFNNFIVIGDTDFYNYDVHSIRLDVERIYNFYKTYNGVNAHLLKPIYLKKTEAEEKIGDIND